jgi:hypothetical protein
LFFHGFLLSPALCPITIRGIDRCSQDILHALGKEYLQGQYIFSLNPL